MQKKEVWIGCWLFFCGLNEDKWPFLWLLSTVGCILLPVMYTDVQIWHKDIDPEEVKALVSFAIKFGSDDSFL